MKKEQPAVNNEKKKRFRQIGPDHEGDFTKFVFNGTIVKKYINNKSATIVMALPVKEGRRTVTDYPRVHFYGAQVKEAAYFKELEQVEVTGVMQNTRLKPDENIFRQHQTYVGTKIESVSLKTKEILEREEDCDDLEMELSRSENLVEIRGIVESAYKGNGGQMRITISTSPDMKRMAYIQALAYNSQADVYNEIRIGHPIHAKGYCATRNAQNREGKVIHYEDFIISSIEED